MLPKRSTQLLPVLPQPFSAGPGSRAGSPHTAAVASPAEEPPNLVGCRDGGGSEPDRSSARSSTVSRRNSVTHGCAACRSCCRK